MSFSGERFSEFIKKRNLTTVELITILEDRYQIKTTLDTIKSYRRKNNTRIPSLDKLKAFAEILGITIDELSGKPAISSVKTIPITANANCGSCDINILQDFSMETIVSENEWHKDLYAVIANGDSMATEIYDEDIVIIDPTIKPITGDMVYYKIDDEGAIKIFINDKDNNMYQFVPFNSNDCFKTRNIRLDETNIKDRLTIHKVIHVLSSKKNNRSARLKMIGR